MPIPSLISFETSTKNKKAFQSARGPNIKKIDDALRAWETRQASATPPDKVALLAVIISACSKWLKTKRMSDEDSTSLRRTHITNLANAALDELQTIGGVMERVAFDRRKIAVLGGGSLSRNGRLVPLDGSSLSRNGKLAPLGGSYANERKLYLESKKTFAPSGTLFHKYILQSDVEPFDAFKKFKGKEFEALTEADFSKMAGLAKKANLPGEVEYLKKGERLQYWVVSVNGLLCYKTAGGAVTTTFSYIWTMDDYGNLFCADAQREMQFNHSSFNSGKDVICGGGIKIDKGQLLYIDNTSGHYRPDRGQLHRAIAILDDDGVDLADTTVGVYEAAPDGRMKTYKYPAKVFLNNVNAHTNDIVA